MPTHPHRLRTVRPALAVALTLTALLGGCGDDAGDRVAPTPEGTTVEGTESAGATTTEATPITADPSLSCVGDDWSVVEAGPFRFLTPPDLVDQSAQGIDSLTGVYAGDTMTATFDYGWYSPDFQDLVDAGASASAVVVDGFEGRVIEADLTTIDDYEGDWLVALHVPAVEQDEFSETSLALWIDVAAEADLETAICITRTVDFS